MPKMALAAIPLSTSHPPTTNVEHKRPPKKYSRRVGARPALPKSGWKRSCGFIE